MGSNGLVSLLDLDGVLVDNIPFEKAVTNYIISYIAEVKATSIKRATHLWQESLAKGKGSTKWYDYDWHCLNLGIPPIAREAHDFAKEKLCSMPGAEETLNFFEVLDVEVYVISDACRWVIDFKLSSLKFKGYTKVFSAQDILATKRDLNCWLQLKKVTSDKLPILYVDNKVDNIVRAKQVFGKLSGIYFNKLEHSLMLSEEISPRRNTLKAMDIDVLLNHTDLQELIMEKIGATHGGQERDI